LISREDIIQHLRFNFDESAKKLNITQNFVLDKNITLPEKIKLVKEFKNKITKKNYMIICTDRLVYKQDISDLKSLKKIFELKEEFNVGLIIDIFDVPEYTSKKNLIMISTNKNHLFEIEIEKLSQISDSSIIAYTKGKNEGKSKVVKYDVKLNNNSYFNYNCLIGLDDNLNPKSAFAFDSSHSIICCKYRPKNQIIKDKKFNQSHPYYKLLLENHIVISFSNNTLVFFHVESKYSTFEFVSYYGNFIGLEFSQDGRLLAAGTESDLVFIIDCETNEHLYTLEGHKNFVSQLKFFESQLEPEESTIVIDSKTSANISTNQINNNLRRKSSNVIRLVEVDCEEMRNTIYKEKENGVNKLNVDYIKRHKILGANIFTQNNEEYNKVTSTYDIVTAGYDGYIGVWKIEHNYLDEYLNTGNYSDINPINKSCNVVNIDMTQNRIFLFPNDSNKIPFINMLKIFKNPVIDMLITEDILVLYTKKTLTGEVIFLKIFNGVVKIEDLTEENNLFTSTNVDDDPENMITERKKSDVDMGSKGRVQDNGKNDETNPKNLNNLNIEKDRDKEKEDKDSKKNRGSDKKLSKNMYDK
jgi:hypothetical protein